MSQKHEYRRVEISIPGGGDVIFYKFTDGKPVELILNRKIYGVNMDAEPEEYKAILQAMFELKPITTNKDGIEFTMTPSVCSAHEYETEVAKIVVRSRMRKSTAARDAV